MKKNPAFFDIRERPTKPDPFLTIGDFNARKGDSSLHYLLRGNGNPLPLGEVLYNRVDGILSQAGQFEVVETNVISNEEASDHSAIVAVVEFSAENPR